MLVSLHMFCSLLRKPFLAGNRVSTDIDLTRHNERKPKRKKHFATGENVSYLKTFLRLKTILISAAMISRCQTELPEKMSKN